MPTRDIKESCRTSLSLASISRHAECLFWRLLTYADDFGRFPAHVGVLRAQCFSVMLDTVAENDVAAWLMELETADLVRLYEGDGGKRFGLFTTWRKHQRVRAKHSKYPAPTSAGMCRQMPTSAPSSTVVPENTENTDLCSVNGSHEAQIKDLIHATAQKLASPHQQWKRRA